MAQDLPAQIAGAAGAPATMRVGTIVSTAPFQLSVQGAVFNEDAVGVLGSYIPQPGDNVPVVGQSKQTGSDPSTWLILGDVRPPSAPPVQTGRFLDGAVPGVVTLASAVSAETNLNELNLSAPVVNGGMYLLHVQIRATVTVTTDDWNLRVRRDSALTGTEIAISQFSGSDLIDTPLYLFPFFSTADETVSFFFSIERSAGAGTVTVIGSPNVGVVRTWSGVSEAGYSEASGGVWRST